MEQGLEVELASLEDSPSEYLKAKRQSFDSFKSIKPLYLLTNSIIDTKDIASCLLVEAIS